MTIIQEYMTADHRRCDTLFSLAEESVNQENWEAARQQTGEFIDAMEHHFTMEEQILFPRFEERTGITAGPTMVMLDEHQQMRELLQELEQALDTRDQGDYLATMETLLIFMQQHNMKEEEMLYPMSDEELGTDAEEIVADMQKIADL